MVDGNIHSVTECMLLWKRHKLCSKWMCLMSRELGSLDIMQCHTNSTQCTVNIVLFLVSGDRSALCKVQTTVLQFK